MCGIAGILSLAPDRDVVADELPRMAACLCHRGPDDEGTYVDPQRRCGLAFRRLSIIDVAGGHQPLANEDETIWAVFNGEIYNFQTLRADLLARGHRFRTQTDSEVIVHLYEEVGEACFEQLAGMFAIAIWDARRGQLVLGRDRVGKKPLTYAMCDGRLYFASEAKAILALPHVPRELDLQALHEYLVFQYVPAPHSVYRGFHKLPPGHRLTIAAGKPLRAESMAYWTLPQEKFRGTYADARAQLDTLLRAAVQKRLVADVPLGAFLSGGLDSSIVVALMRELGVSPLRTFSIGFPQTRYDETAYARLVAEQCDTEHHEHIVTPAAREILDTLAYHYDEPFADSSAIPTYYVSKYTRESVTVALTGDGGDEGFAGYDRYRAAQAAARLDFLPRMMRRALSGVAAWVPHARARTFSNRLYRFLAALGAEPARRYLAWINVFDPGVLRAAYRDDVGAALDLDGPERWFAGQHGAVAGSAAERANRADIATYLPYDLLTKVDIASMACSLECRAPLLDHELLAFAASLPLDWRLGATGGKRILKDWARDRLPAAVIDRPKMGFGVPVGEWFRDELSDFVRETLLPRDALCRRLFRGAWLEGYVTEHLSGRRNHEHPLWALLMLELWYRRWRPELPFGGET